MQINPKVSVAALAPRPSSGDVKPFVMPAK
jgi:hypothetical protein